MSDSRYAPHIEATSGPDCPFYLPVGNEVQIFRAAWRRGLAIMLKGPTGCGKTRFVEHMAHRVSRPVYSVACHEDLTAADLVGRYLLVGGETVWVDGPLSLAVRNGGICYLDEIVEARQDTTVVLHPLADYRRELTTHRDGGTTESAADGFCLVVSYNPGYQSVLKDLKVSTRQRMVTIELGFPPPEVERQIVAHEAGVSASLADDLVRLGQAIRNLQGVGLREAASTRVLIAAALLTAEGLSAAEAAHSAIAGSLTDDRELTDGLIGLIDRYLSDTGSAQADRIQLAKAR